MQYFKRRWGERRGDRFDDWGHSWWYFATGSDGNVHRQIEKYDSGAVLRYDKSHPQDELGKLSEAALDLEEFAPFEISAEEFEEAWVMEPSANRNRVPNKLEVEVFSEATNAAVVRVPGRQFPGIVIQGDTLSTLCNDAIEIANLARSLENSDVADAAVGLRDRLDRLFQHYVSVLEAHGMSLPFVRPPVER